MAKKILLIDDEPVLVKVLTSRFKTNGYEVVVAIDGQEGLNKARTEKPDLIVMDLMLPKLDGYRVCSLLKLDDNFKHIPIIILTARVQPQDQEKGMQAGADAYLLKPFKPEILTEKIRELLKADSE